MSYSRGEWVTVNEPMYTAIECEGKLLAAVKVRGQGNNEGRANARLMAAAPKLLEACHACYADLNGQVADRLYVLEKLKSALEAAGA